MQIKHNNAPEFLDWFKLQRKGESLKFTQPKQTATPESNTKHFRVSDAIEANNREDTTLDCWNEEEK